MARDMELKRQRDRERGRRIREQGGRPPDPPSSDLTPEQLALRRARYARRDAWRAFMRLYARMCAEPGVAVAGIVHLDRTEAGWRDQ